MESYYLIQDLALIGVAAMIVTWIFTLLKMPLLLGYILVGIMVSPVFGILHEGRNIVQMGELGVMFMMFFIGMEFNFERIKKVMFPSLFAITSQIVVMTLFGLALAHILKLSDINGLFLGAILAMSSTIVLVEILTQRKELSKYYAQVAVGILVLEDLFAIILMVVLSTLGGGSKLDLMQLAQRCLVMTTFVVSVYIVGKLCIPWLIRKFALSKNPQVVIMFVFCFMLGLGEFASMMELSTSLGAFLAGSILSGTAMSSKIENLTNSFRNLFVALFFVSVGTMIDPVRILQMWLPILLISAAVVVFKIAACWIGVVFGGVSCKNAYLVAVNKAQIGEFSFVIASLGISMGILDSSILVIAMGVSFLTIFVNPFLSARGEASADFFARIAPKRILMAFEVYKRTVGVVLTAAHRNSYMKNLFLPFVKTCVYFLLFNGVMVGAAIVCEYATVFALSHEMAFRRAVFTIGVLVGLPLVFGFVNSVKEFVSAAIAGLPIFLAPRLGRVKGKLTAFMRTIFSTVAIAMVGMVYFVVFLYYFPYRDVAIAYFIMATIMAFVFRRFIVGVNGNLEASFLRIFRRHIENADSHQREVMIENIKNNYAWVSDVLEVDIPELACAGGKTVRELSIRNKTGAEIIAIKRGRFVVYDILPETRIFPDDIVVLSGDSAAIKKAEYILTEQITDFDLLQKANDIFVKCYIVGDSSKLVNCTLAQSGISRLYSVRIVGIIREGDGQTIHPTAADIFKRKDKILAIGVADNLEEFSKSCSLSPVNS